MRVSAIVVNRDARQLLLACVESLQQSLEAVEGDTEVIVVDNDSRDDSILAVKTTFPAVHAISLFSNRGFAAAVTKGIEASSGDWILLLNNDATIEADAVVRLLEAAREKDDVGSLAAQLLFADGSGVINSAGLEIDRLGVAYDRLVGQPSAASEQVPVEVFGTSGGCALLRRRMLDDVGGLDASFFMFLEDADLAWRARMRGWKSLYVPAAVACHHHSATAGHATPPKYFHVGLNRVRLLAKNATGAHLARFALPIVAFDLGYVAYVALKDRTLAPLHGRLRGLAQWPRYRALGSGRKSVALAPVAGPRAALRRRKAWMMRSSGVRRPRLTPSESPDTHQKPTPHS